MKDTEARQQIKRVESKSDKIRRGLEVEIRAGQSKDDKERQRLISQVDDLYRRLIILEDAVYSKFIKREFWEEIKDTDNPE